MHDIFSLRGLGQRVRKRKVVEALLWLGFGGGVCKTCNCACVAVFGGGVGKLAIAFGVAFRWWSLQNLQLRLCSGFWGWVLQNLTKLPHKHLYFYKNIVIILV